MRSKAKEKDQYETPEMLKKDWFDSVGLTEEDAFDLCFYREGWRPKINFDALEEAYSNRLNWGKIPFSSVLLYLIKATIEFLKGKNIVLLLSTYQLMEKKFY